MIDPLVTCDRTLELRLVESTPVESPGEALVKMWPVEVRADLPQDPRSWTGGSKHGDITRRPAAWNSRPGRRRLLSPPPGAGEGDS